MKLCSECQTEFEPTNNRQLACVGCKLARDVRIKRERRQADPEVQLRQRQAVARYRERNRDDSWRRAICLLCSKEFDRKTIKKQYCSDSCRDRAKYRSDITRQEKKKTWAKRWSRANPDRVKANRKAYYQSHWFEFQERNAANRDRTLPAVLVREVMESDNYTCQYCGQRGGKLTIDHKMPISRGGTDDRENLCIACHSCNCSKGAKTPEEFAAYKQELAHACSH